MRKATIVYFTMFLVLCAIVVATFTYTQNAPAAYMVSDNVSINLNWSVVNSEYEGWNHSIAIQTGYEGLFNDSHNWTNATDSNFTTFALAPELSNSSVIWYNFTGIPTGTKNSSQIQVKDAGGTVNISIDDACWAQTVKEFMVNLSDRGVSESTATNCYNGSHWEQIRSTSAGASLYDVKMWWDITNHTEFPCDILTKYERSGNWTTNISGVRVTNGTWTNKTIEFNDGDRVWWRTQCKNDFSGVASNSSIRIFDVDVAYNTIFIYADLNLTTYNLKVGGCIQYNCSQSTGCVTLGVCS